MESVQDTPLLKQNFDTLYLVRKEFDLHKPGRMKESVDRLREWIAAQPHFNKTDYSTEYLETFIINAKGSVEKAKITFEKLCAYKTFGPQYFSYATKPIDLKGLENIEFFFMPRLTKENYRILLLRNTANMNYTLRDVLNYVTKTHIMVEYLMKHSVSLGMTVILDYRNTNISSLISAMKYTDSRNAFGPFFKGYSHRVKSLHIITTSKVVDLFLMCVSQIISSKMLGRIYVHANVEELYEHFDKDLLPSDFGGKEKSIIELNDDWDKELSKDDFMEYIKDIFQATINPALKPIDKFDDPFLGINGTFRSLSFD